MSPAYIGAITHHCPNVTLVIDRFHLVKALNQAVDEVRKEQWRALDTPGRKAIKGLRWLLSRHSRHRTRGHTRFLNSLRNSNRRIHRAWVLKDEFEHFWDVPLSGLGEDVPPTLDDGGPPQSPPHDAHVCRHPADTPACTSWRSSTAP